MTTAALSDRDVQRIAWTVLLSSFVAFIILIVGAPLLGLWFLNTATDSHESSLAVLSGTVIVELPGREPSGERASRMVPEGATIRTDANTRVNLTLFDGSTVIVFPDTQVILSAIRSPKFEISPQRLQAYLELRSGRLRLSATSGDRALDMSVQTPQGYAQFQSGNYLVEVAGEQTEVVVRNGQALLKAHELAVRLNGRERSIVKTGERPRGPLPAERDLIVNGGFAAALNETWKIYNDQGGDGGDVDGQAQLEIDQGRRLVHFTRQGSNGNHDDTGVEQFINKDVSDAESIRLRADVRINYQSLSGGGYLSSEFPLMIRIKYIDVKGGQNAWVHGFYYQNEARSHIVNGEQVPQGLWYPYESQDLTDILNPKPALILSIQIYASGHDFDSMVSDVGLIVE